MKLKTKLSTILFALVITYANAQIKDYHFKRELTGITGAWHKVILPDSLYKNAAQNLSDIRIFGITEEDTIEAAYVWRIKSEKTESTPINFRILNSSKAEKGYYFTLQVPTQAPVNKLLLAFKQFNFDWHVSLEGSQNQLDWFTIVEDSRILSIKNAQTFYQYTQVTFPSSSYKFYRLLVKSDVKPDLKDVKISFNTVFNGIYNDYSVKDLETLENKTNNSTVLNINLKNTVPISYINIHVNGNYDYYRPVTLQYVADSIYTEKGWQYNYRTLTQGVLNSIEPNSFTFKSAIVKKIKITIDNKDNETLSIDSVNVKGYVHELAIRFTTPATYYLTYGNSNVYKPNYDIARFTSKIPENLTALKLGQEQIIEKPPVLVKKPLFENKLWLWGLIVATVLILGWFTFRMIKAK
jgi:hypothetical protein